MLEKLETMSRSELLELRENVKRAIEEEEQLRHSNALKAVHEAAKSYGYKLEDLLGKSARGRSKPAVIPKYRHPDDPSKTWGGLGRRPAWLESELKAGKKIEEFAIA